MLQGFRNHWRAPATLFPVRLALLVCNTAYQTHVRVLHKTRFVVSFSCEGGRMANFPLKSARA
jgi:hypothetical protein